MSLVESLLGAIVRLDGDSLVLHTGEKPYVVTVRASMGAFRGPVAWGQVELSTRTLTSDALLAMLDQMLTLEQRRVLDELGAVENELPATNDLPAFVVVAARGGDDIWVEIRPVRPKPAAAPVAAVEAPAVAPEPAVPVSAPPVDVPAPPREALAPHAGVIPEPEFAPEAEMAPAPEPAPEAEGLPEPAVAPEPVVAAPPVSAPPAPLAFERNPEFIAAEEEEEEGEELEEPAEAREEVAHPSAFEVVHDVEQEHPDEEDVAQLLASAGLLESEAPRLIVEDEEAEEFVLRPDVAPEGGEGEDEEAGSELEEISLEPEMPTPAVVVPLARTIREAPEPPRSRPAPAAVPPTSPEIERLLRVAAARGASGLYLVAQTRPAVRVDGEMQHLESEEPLSGGDVEALMLALAPEPTRDAVRSGETSEWFRDVAEIGRVRCLSFRDHRGPGVIVRMLPARAISAEQLGLSMDIRALCGQPDGLVLVAGPRASGKSTLIAAFVDLVNRTRADHVVAIERQITFIHESRRSFVSQREVRGEAGEVLAAVRAALREDPDVLVVEELRSPEVIAAVLDAAESGRLVIAGLRAPAAVQALERLIDQVPAERRAHALAALSTSLRAVVGQVLLRKRGGGRVAARELLLNTPAAASIIAEGKLFQLAAALESGRKLGSVPLNDALAALIRDGLVDAGEAWRKAYDREGLLTQLKREGIDTSFVERLA